MAVLGVSIRNIFSSELKTLDTILCESLRYRRVKSTQRLNTIIVQKQTTQVFHFIYSLNDFIDTL
jgi:hypothetical protein